jgi:superfamily II DNA or RNA helicase
MLEKILLNFSEDELYSFLNRTSIDFAMKVTQQKGEIEGLTKNQLATIIANSKQVEFVFNEKLRNLLIDRLTPDTFVLLFPEFELLSKEINPKHYEAAIEWASGSLQEFAIKIGLEESYQNELDNSNSIESISRIEPIYSLYPYQQQISKDVFSSLQQGKKRVLIHLPTGAGKTRTAMNIASEHLRQSSTNVVLWLADREELCQQAFQEFEKAWRALGNQPTTLYGFYSDSDESLSGIDSGFVIGGLHKFLHLRKSDSRKLELLYKELRKSVTLVIFDEAHKSVAPQFSQVIDDFISGDDFNADLIGLTATPGRSYSADGLSQEDKLLANFYHNNKISMKIQGYISPIDYLVDNGYLAKANFKPLSYDHSGIAAYELSDAGGQETMKALSNNVERNKKIINTIVSECELGSQIIVFACTVEHGINLAVTLACLGIKAASIDSKNDTSESRRVKIQQYKQKKLQVLVNFNVLTAGFDAPKTNVSVIAKPMNSLVQYLQMAGRAMRGYKSGGNKECRVYTVMDDIPEFQSVNIAFEYWNDMWLEEGK